MSQLQVTGEAKIRDLQGPVVANSGVITALDGLPSQYVRGDGTLADIPSVTGGGSSVSYYLNGSVNQGTFAGSTYYQMSKDAITGVGTNFSSSTDGLLAQFITDANDPDVSSIPSGNWNIEFYMGVSASSGALASFYVEFYKWNGSAFTFLASNVATPEFLTNTTTVDAYFTSVAFPETPLATTDRLAIRVYANVASKTVTMYTEDNRLCQIVTTFSKGLLSMNSLTDQEQYLTVGTAGTDFNIVSSIDTHTFNIPVASATNTGKLSSTDWSTFNNKQPAGNYVTLDTTQTITGEKTFSGDTTSITSSYFNLDGITGSTGNALNIKQYATNLVTGVGYSSIGAIDTTKFSFYLGNTSAFDSRIFVLDASNLTINTTKTYTLPNITGTLALLEGTQTFSGVKTFSQNPKVVNSGSANIQIDSATGNTSSIIFTTNNSITAAIDSNASQFVFRNYLSNEYRFLDTFSSNGGIFLMPAASLRTYTFPDLTGTIALLEGSQTFSGSKTFSENVKIDAGIRYKKNPAIQTASAGYLTTYGTSGFGLSFFDGDSGNESKLAFNTASNYTYTFPASSGTIALTSNLSSYVPYTGATSDVNLGINRLYSTGLTLSTSATAFAPGLTTLNGNANGLTISLGTSSGGSTITYSNQFLFSTNVSNTYTFPNASGTVALTSNFDGYVPYTGATSSLNLGANNITTTGLATLKTIQAGTSTVAGVVALKSPGGVGFSFDSGSINLIASDPTEFRLLYGKGSGNSKSVIFSDTSLTLNTPRTYTLPDASGTLALTSNIPSVSGTSGQVTYFNGTSSVTGSSNHFWDATNNRLGIGLTNPQRSLEIYSATADSHLRLSGSAPSVSLGEAITGSVYQAKFGLATAAGQYVSGAVAGDFVMLSQTGATIFATTATEKMRLTSGGSLGLGTTAPDTYQLGGKFVVAGATSGFYFNDANNRLVLDGAGTNRDLTFYFRYSNTATIDSDSNIRLATSGTPRLTIASTGAATFSSSVTINSKTILGSDGTIKWGNSNGDAGDLTWDTGRAIVVGRSGQALALGADGSEKMRITSGGNVGIGTSSPVSVSGQTSLTVNGTNVGRYDIYVNGTHNAQFLSTSSELQIGSLVNIPFSFYTNGSERMRITSDGNLLVGKSSTNWALGGLQTEVNGTNFGITNTNSTNNIFLRKNDATGLMIQFWYNGTAVGNISISTSSTSYNTTSDYRLKQDFKDYSGLSLISKIKTYDYQWKSDKSRMFGVLAHELQSVIPYAVLGEKDGEQMQGVDYSKIVPVLVKAIQEQQAQIEELSNKIVALESK